MSTKKEADQLIIGSTVLLCCGVVCLAANALWPLWVFLAYLAVLAVAKVRAANLKHASIMEEELDRNE